MKKIVIGFAFLAGLLSLMSCNEIEIKSPPVPDEPEPVFVQEKTLLEFVSSLKMDMSKIFLFKTDPGAVVTMNYEDHTISATADDQGNCTIEFPRLESLSIYAVVTAVAPNKDISDPINVRIPELPADYELDILFDDTEIYFNQEEVDFSKDYGYYDGEVTYEGESIPYLKLNHYVKRGMERSYVKIPFTTSDNIAKVTIEERSGISQFYVSVEPDAGDYSSGYLVIKQVANYNQHNDDTYIVVTGWTSMNVPIVTLSLCGRSYYHIIPATP